MLKLSTPPAAPAEEEDEPLTSEPWIESIRYTSCDECTGINNKMFAYNEEGQAYIKDPRAGTFRELVLAAEKCAPSVIHPGDPLNPDEKDLDKLIERAEKEGSLQNAAELRYGEIPNLEKELEQQNSTLERLQAEGAMLKEEVDAEDVGTLRKRLTITVPREVIDDRLTEQLAEKRGFLAEDGDSGGAGPAHQFDQ